MAQTPNGPRQAPMPTTEAPDPYNGGAYNGTAQAAQDRLPRPVARPWADIRADLGRPVPDRLVSTRHQAGKAIRYVSWPNCVRLLDAYAPGWSKDVTGVHTVPGTASVAADGKVTDLPPRVVVTVRVSVPTADLGLVHRDATGNETVAVTGYGDPVSNAEAMALKRAAANLGLALHMYLDD